MKTLDVETFEQVVTDTQRALKEKSDQISDLQQAIDSFVNMEDAFKGKAGKLAEKAERLRANAGVAPALEAAGIGTTYKIPYNVLHHCKDHILKIVEEQFTTVKYGEHYTKVNRKKALKPNVLYTTSHGYKYNR